MRAGAIKVADWQLHVAPFGTGSQLVRDLSIWDRLSDQARHVHALDMEGAAVGEVGWMHEIQATLVVKGVMDFAEPDRRQFMRAFAAKAAAEVLIALLRAHAQARGRSASDVLQTGIAERPALATNPGSLLHPRYQVVEFLDSVRERELSELQRWCDDPQPLAARLFYGPGGAGKTRLLQEWAARLRQQGWSAGFLPAAVSDADLELVLGAGGPTCVVLDYAETRIDLLDLMQRIAMRSGQSRLRVVLLAREVADWWKSLLHRNDSEAVAGLLRAHEPRLIAEVPLEGDARAAVFHAAVAAFAPILHKPAVVPMPDLTDPRYGRALYLAMAALAAVEGAPIRVDSILSNTVARERRFWLHRFTAEIGKSSEARAAFTEGVSRFMAAVTLRGWITLGASAEGLLQRTRGPTTEHLLRWLVTAYPKRAPVGDQVVGIAPLEPDLLGEQLVLEVQRHHDTPATFFDAVFHEAARPDYTAGFLVLGRLGARRDGEQMHVWIERLIGDAAEDKTLAALAAILTLRAETAFAPIGPLLAKALDTGRGSLDIARAIEVALDANEPSLTMRELRAWSTRRQLAELEASTDTHEERGRLFNSLGVRLSELGQPEAALAAAQEAVAAYRALAKARPEAFLPDLAMSLNNLSNRLSELGQREAALAAALEAVALSVVLTQERPEVFKARLKGYVKNLAARLGEAQQPVDTNATVQAAVQLLARLDALPENPGGDAS